MDKWSQKEFKVNLFLAGATFVVGIVLYAASGVESVHQDYSTTMNHMGMVLSGLALVWGFSAAFKWTLQS